MRGGELWRIVAVVPFLEELETDFEISTGDEESIGVLIMTSGSAEDRNIPDGPPFNEGAIPANRHLIGLSNMTNIGVRLPSQRKE